MRAVIVREFGEPEAMVVEEVATPEPGVDEVRIRVQAAGVNPVDTYIRSGVYANKPGLPYTPGADASGVVDAVGANVVGLSVGDRVYVSATSTGTYAEFAICPANGVHPLPDALDFSQGAGIHIPYATAYQSLFHRASAQPGETLLVHGASGGVGLAAVQLAVARGIRVIGTAGTPEGVQLVLDQGADHAVNHRDGDYLDRIRAITGGNGVDIVLEMLSNVNLANDLTILAKFGRIVVIGCRGPIEINPRAAMALDASIHGMILFNATPSQQRAIHAALFAGFSSGVLRPVVGKELPLEEAAEAHRAVLRPGAHGKIVLIP